jgi:hypothetical protein
VCWREVTIHAPAHPTRSTRSIGWVPFALVCLVLIPGIAGSLRLVELSDGPLLLPPVMTGSAKRQTPSSYRLRVGGHLDQHWSCWFGDLTLTHEDDGTTSLTGVISDQAELHGLLDKIRDLGVTLFSVEVVDPCGGVDRGSTPALRDR